MTFRSLPFFSVPFCLVAALFLTGCPRPTTLPPPPPPFGDFPVPEVSTAGAVCAVWTVPASQTPASIVEFLSARPDLRLTAVFPARFAGDDEASKEAKAALSALVAEGRVEPLLTLPSRPVLALIHDSDLARLSTTTARAPLPPRFARPEDVTGLVGLAKGQHRRRWRKDPSGLALPWGVAVGPELEPLARLKIKWFYRGAGPEARLESAEGFPIVTAALFPPAKEAAGRGDWWRRVALSSGTAVVAVSTLEELDALLTLAPPAQVSWETLSERLRNAPPTEAASVPDLSFWIGEPEKNRAWQLLGVVREALESFKNSGRAEVQTLDRASREMYAAQDADVFRRLGGGGTSSSDMGEVKRSFLATLAQVYRFMGLTPPQPLQHGFSGTGSLSAQEAPFFARSGGALVWSDAVGDDRGPGDYFHPTGARPDGVWDLRRFRVEAGEENIVFEWKMGALFNPDGAPYGFGLSLLDVYIDINHLPGAGSESLLLGRAGLLEPQNAWEYALSVDGWGARLYQYAPGGARRVGVFPVKPGADGTLRVSIPRRHWRGEPADWGFAALVMGRSGAGGEPVPMRVAAEPAADRFGGAAKGSAAAPPYIDILASGGAQEDVLGAYKAGRDIVVPFVQAE